MKKKNTTLLLGRNIVWAIVIFVLCAMPGESVPNPHLNIPHLDKIVHFGMFFVMALLICNELEYQTRLKQRTIFIIAISITCLYGGIIEILQHKYFNRSGDHGFVSRRSRRNHRLFSLLLTEKIETPDFQFKEKIGLKITTIPSSNNIRVLKYFTDSIW